MISTEDPIGVFTTPTDMGYTVQLEFNGDMSFNRYQDNLPNLTGVYWVRELEYEGHIIDQLTFDYGGVSPAKCAYGINSDGLLELFWGADPQTGLPSFPIELYAPRGPVFAESRSWGGVKALYR